MFIVVGLTGIYPEPHVSWGAGGIVTELQRVSLSFFFSFKNGMMVKWSLIGFLVVPFVVDIWRMYWGLPEFRKSVQLNWLFYIDLKKKACGFFCSRVRDFRTRFSGITGRIRGGTLATLAFDREPERERERAIEFKPLLSRARATPQKVSI